MNYVRQGDYTFELYSYDWSTIVKQWRVKYWNYTADGYDIMPFGENIMFEIKGNIKFHENQ